MLETVQILHQKSQPANDTAHKDADERWVELNAVLESRTFAKSNRLAQFLKYICTQAIDGHAKQINEQQIGVHVFARSPSYSAVDDSIVRTQARLLRQRLEEYFEHEAPNAPLIISIPKGGYVPLFEARSVAQAVAPHAGRGEANGSTQSAEMPLKTGAKYLLTARFFRIAAFAIGTIFLLLAAAYAWQAMHHKVSAAELLWKTIFQGNRPVLIVPSDDALVLFEEQNKVIVPLDDYLNGSYLNRPTSPVFGSSVLTADWFARHQYTSVADLKLAVRFAQLPAARNAPIETRYARGFRIDDLKGANVILIGGLAANPWINLYRQHLDFEVNYDWKNNEGYVLNRKPQQGEVTIYREGVVDGSLRSYGVLAFVPGLEGSSQALLFEGTGMAGTESAADFLFDSSAFEAFARRIGATSQRIPYFEALLETTSVGGNAPGVRVLTYHLIRY